MKVLFDFVDNQPLPTSAFADGHILDIQLPAELAATFLMQLTERPAMQVIFPDDDSDTWLIQGRGAKAAIQKFVACLRNSR